MTVIVDNISCSHYRVGPDGKMSAKTKAELQKFWTPAVRCSSGMSSAMNRACWRRLAETIELAKCLNEIKPPHVQTAGVAGLWRRQRHA